MADALDIAKRWIAAYNAKDFETLASLMNSENSTLPDL